MITYEWENLHTLPALYGVPRQIEWYGTLTFDSAGHFQSPDLRDGYPEVMPYFGVRYSMAGELSAAPQHCADVFYVDVPPNCALLGDLVITTGPRLLFNASLDAGPQILQGFIELGNTSSDFAAHSEGSVWHVDRLTSDDEQWYCSVPFCEGMTGRWTRDWTVPEPSMISFVLVALVIVYKLRRHL